MLRHNLEESVGIYWGGLHCPPPAQAGPTLTVTSHRSPTLGFYKMKDALLNETSKENHTLQLLQLYKLALGSEPWADAGELPTRTGRDGLLSTTSCVDQRSHLSDGKPLTSLALGGTKHPCVQSTLSPGSLSLRVSVSTEYKSV